MQDDESLRRWKEQLLGQVDTEQLGGIYLRLFPIHHYICFSPEFVDTFLMCDL
jgi:hypothetical protein